MSTSGLMVLLQAGVLRVIAVKSRFHQAA